MKRIVVFSLLLLCNCFSVNLEDIKSNAGRVFEAQGLKVLGYQGYQHTPMGAQVWFTLERNGKLYQGSIIKYNDEYHVYSLTLIDKFDSR